MNSTKFFRAVWRINGVIILGAAGLAAIGIAGFAITSLVEEHSQRRTQPPAIVAAESGARLCLNEAKVVPGTDVIRAELVRYGEVDGVGSKGGYSETRNVLLIAQGVTEGRWLLPDDDHVIEELEDIEDASVPQSQRVLATAAFIRPAAERQHGGLGRILLFNYSGQFVEIATGVSRFHFATLAGKDMRVVYERNQHLVEAVFAPESLNKREERQIALPPLK